MTSESIGDVTGSPWCLKIDVNELVKSNETTDKLDAEVQQKKVQFKGKFCVVKVGFPTSPDINRENLPDKDPDIALHLNVSGTDLSSTIYEYWADRIEYFNREYFYLSACFPSKCSYEDISKIVSLAPQNETQLDIKLTRYCNSVEEESIKPKPLRATLCLAAIIILVVTVVICTLVNQVIKNVTPGNEEDEKTFKAIDNFTKHFNVITAHEKLLTPLETESAKRMKSMDFYITIVQVKQIRDILIEHHLLPF